MSYNYRSLIFELFQPPACPHPGAALYTQLPLLSLEVLII